MRRSLFILAAAAFVYGSAAEEKSKSGTDFSTSEERRHLITEVNSLSRLLFELAAERYVVNSNRSDVCIITMHNGRTIRKYNDGTYTIISLPVVEPSDRIALCRYAEQYNCFSVYSADLNTTKGNYREAIVLYRLLLHFDNCRGLFRERLETRLSLAEKLNRGEDLESNLRKFKELIELDKEPSPRTDYSRIDKLKPTIVTNLLQIRLP